MVKVIITAPAAEDLADIWEYIARDKITAADAFLERMDETFAQLARQPGMGERYRRSQEVRRISVGNYVVYYRVEEMAAYILRVLHGARRPKGLS